MTQTKAEGVTWYQVVGYSPVPLGKVFIRETACQLVWLDGGGRERRSSKSTSYETWYPTREAAQAVIDSRLERRNKQTADKRVRDAAPCLLEALQAVELARMSDEPDHWQRATDLTQAAISKALGEDK